jgi:hypothetical protein
VARIPEAEIERLKAEVSLAESAGVTLRRTGDDLTGCCPFHEDSTPSLVISPAKNLWHCLGACQAGGSVIDWVMRAEGVSFRHAVELLRDGMPAVSAGPAPKRSTALAHLRGQGHDRLFPGRLRHVEARVMRRGAADPEPGPVRCRKVQWPQHGPVLHPDLEPVSRAAQADVQVSEAVAVG